MKRLLFLMLLLSLPVLAQTGADPEAQVKSNKLAESSFLKVDAECESLYEDILSRLDGVQKERFEKSHQEWKEYREAEVFARVTPHIGGLVAIEVDYVTRAEVTQKRLEILQQWIEYFSY